MLKAIRIREYLDVLRSRENLLLCSNPGKESFQILRTSNNDMQAEIEKLRNTKPDVAKQADVWAALKKLGHE